MGLLALCALPILQAGQYGSASPFTFTGTYTLPDSVITTTLSNGDIRDKVTWKVIRVSSADVLREMEARGLFRFGTFVNARATEFRLTLVSRAHHGHGVAFFARSAEYGPVAVPADLLTFETDDGPINGTAVVSSVGDLVSLRRSTHNLATLTRPGLVAKGAVRQSWTMALKGNPQLYSADGHRDAEAVELATGTGRVTGTVTVGDKTGIAELSLVIGKPRAVDLTPYGMATEERHGGFPTGNTYGDSMTTIGYEGVSGSYLNPSPTDLIEMARGRLVPAVGGLAPVAEVYFFVDRSIPDNLRYIPESSVNLADYLGGTITLMGGDLDNLPDYTILDAEGRVTPITTNP